MNISITEVSGLKDTILAAGIKTILDGIGLPVNVGQTGTLPVAETPAKVIVHTPAPKATKQKALPAPAPKPKRVPTSDGRHAGPTDPRGSIRDAVRAALNTTGKDIVTMTQEVQRTFPEKNRDYIGTVLCQIAKGGECELGEDGKWRKAA
jgi:hypothetical protein